MTNGNGNIMEKLDHMEKTHDLAHTQIINRLDTINGKVRENDKRISTIEKENIAQNGNVSLIRSEIRHVGDRVEDHKKYTTKMVTVAVSAVGIVLTVLNFVMK